MLAGSAVRARKTSSSKSGIVIGVKILSRPSTRQFSVARVATVSMNVRPAICVVSISMDQGSCANTYVVISLHAIQACEAAANSLFVSSLDQTALSCFSSPVVDSRVRRWHRSRRAARFKVMR